MKRLALIITLLLCASTMFAQFPGGIFNPVTTNVLFDSVGVLAKDGSMTKPIGYSWAIDSSSGFYHLKYTNGNHYNDIRLSLSMWDGSSASGVFSNTRDFLSWRRNDNGSGNREFWIGDTLIYGLGTSLSPYYTFVDSLTGISPASDARTGYNLWNFNGGPTVLRILNSPTSSSQQKQYLALGYNGPASVNSFGGYELMTYARNGASSTTLDIGTQGSSALTFWVNSVNREKFNTDGTTSRNGAPTTTSAMSSIGLNTKLNLQEWYRWGSSGTGTLVAKIDSVGNFNVQGTITSGSYILAASNSTIGWTGQTLSQSTADGTIKWTNFGQTVNALGILGQLQVGQLQNTTLTPFAVKNFAGTNLLTADTLGQLSVTNPSSSINRQTFNATSASVVQNDLRFINNAGNFYTGINDVEGRVFYDNRLTGTRKYSWQFNGNERMTFDSTNLSVGITDANFYTSYANSRGFMGYNAAGNLMTIQGVVSKGIAFNVGNTFPSGEIARFNTTGEFGVGIVSATTSRFSVKAQNTNANIFEGYRSASGTATVIIDTNGTGVFVGAVKTNTLRPQSGSTVQLGAATELAYAPQFTVGQGQNSLLTPLTVKNYGGTVQYSVDTLGFDTGTTSRRDTAAFSGTNARLAVYHPGTKSTDNVSATIRLGSDSAPAGADVPQVFCKTDSVIIWRATTTVSGMKISLQQIH